MKTLSSFAVIKPGTTWRLKPSPFPGDSKAQWSMLGKVPFCKGTFAAVPLGYMFDTMCFGTTPRGNPLPCTKLRRTHWVSESLRGQYRAVNAIFCRTGEPVWIDDDTGVFNVREPEHPQIRRLRRTFLDNIGKTVVRVGIVHECPTMEEDPASGERSGTLEFVEDPTVSPR